MCAFIPTCLLGRLLITFVVLHTKTQSERPAGSINDANSSRIANSSVEGNTRHATIEVHARTLARNKLSGNLQNSRFSPREVESKLEPENVDRSSVEHFQAELDAVTQSLKNAEEELGEALAEEPLGKGKPPPKRKAPVPPSTEKLVLALALTNVLAVAFSILGMLAYCSAWPFSLLYTEQATTVEFVQGYIMSDRFSGNLLYSIIVPDSLELAEAISEGAIYSGWVIGIYKGLAWLGLALGLLLCGMRNKDRMRNLWICIFIGKLMALSGSAMFLAIMVYREHVPHASSWILLARSIAGIGVGLAVLPVELILVHTTTIAERPLILAKAVFNVTLGIGLGPLLASGTRSLHEAICGTEYGAMEAVMCWPVMLSIVSLITLFYIPDAHEYIDTQSEDFLALQRRPSYDGADSKFIEEPDFVARRIGIVTCSVVVGLRGAIVSGLEAATAMILERDYTVPKKIIGVLIGLTFLVSVPARLIFTYCKDWLTVREWIRLTMCISFLGSLFLFRSVERFLANDSQTPVVLLLVADSLLYCSIYQVSGLVEGIMTTFALPIGSLFTVDFVIVLKCIALDCTGRMLGPPLARMQLESGGVENGQDGYAWQQLSMTLLATLLTEAVLLRVMDIVEETPRQKVRTSSREEQADDTDALAGSTQPKVTATAVVESSASTSTQVMATVAASSSASATTPTMRERPMTALHALVANHASAVSDD